MIITLTPNPSLDRTYVAGAFVPGAVNRASAARVDAGGKGINVSRALSRCGLGTVAVFPSGGFDGHRLVATLAGLGVPARPVSVPGETRSNVTLVDGLGITTKINAPGTALSPASTTELLDTVCRELATVDGASATVVGAGSVPPGTDDGVYARVTRAVRARGGRMVLDASGASFAAAVRAGGLALVTPNEDELAEVVGRPLRTVGDAARAAQEIMAMGTERVLVSLGAHGALLVAPEGVWWAGGPALVPRSTVGAGDATLAGFLAARSAGTDLPGALCHAVAWGRAAVLSPGSDVPGPDDIDLDTVVVRSDPLCSIRLKEL